MTYTCVLRIPQVDTPSHPFLVHVSQKKAANLDLDILATDGEVAYRGKVRQRNLSKLQSGNFKGTDDEWTSLLRYALLSKRNSGAPSNQTDNLEVDCIVTGQDSEAKLSITLRSRIENITHRLGAIELFYSEDTDDVDLFGWACQLAEQRDRLEEQTISTSKEAQNTKDTISSLEKQLNILIKAKEEHEEQMFSKFAALLNEKKMKIRNQQRILQTAKVNKTALDEMQLTIAGQPKPNPSKRKRNSDKARAASMEEDDESDQLEAMDIDTTPTVNVAGDAESGQETPPRSQTPETETASEDEEGVTPTKATSTKLASNSHPSMASPPPPPRSLPFPKRGETGSAPPKDKPPTIPSVGEDQTTESEDDEL